MLQEVSILFLKLGTTAFGGPAAHIAMMEEEVVKRRKWISPDAFLDLVGATNLIPGPNSTEMAMHIGYLRGGWRGLCAAGLSFILPAVLITLLLAHLYVKFGSIPQVEPFVGGIRPAIIAVIIASVFRLRKPVLKNRLATVLGVLVVTLNLLGVDEILLLLASGAIGLLWTYHKEFWQFDLMLLPSYPLLASGQFGDPVPSAASGSLWGLGLFFLKIGSILYGSGYVLVAFLQSGLVDTRHWLTQGQLVDAVAIGQFTPGPVLSTATCIGYLISGLPGATVATFGIFLPSFLFVLASARLICKMRKSVRAAGFLNGVNAASLALMIAVAIQLGHTTLGPAGSWLIFLLSSAVVIMWNINPAWIVVGSAILGWLFSNVWS
jgi:chromate transporter